MTISQGSNTMSFALSTVEHAGKVLGCIEINDRFHPLESVAAETGLPQDVDHGRPAGLPVRDACGVDVDLPHRLGGGVDPHRVLDLTHPHASCRSVATADTDDRVVPGHSFKFAAALQKDQAGDAPILIRIETRAGHGAGKPTSKMIEEVADVQAFLVKVFGMQPKF